MIPATRLSVFICAYLWFHYVFAVSPHEVNRNLPPPCRGFLPCRCRRLPRQAGALCSGFAPGGANDLVARVVAARMGPRLGQQVVVDNRSGAGGNIAHDITAKAAPDGYTMVLASVASLAMSPALLGRVPYDPIQ